MAEQRSISDRQLAVAITLSAAALAITLTAPLWHEPSEPSVRGTSGVRSERTAPPILSWSTVVAASRPDLAGGAWTPGAVDAQGAGEAVRSTPSTAAPMAEADWRTASRPLAILMPRQVLAAGCCPGVWWSPDSRELWYFDGRQAAGTAVFGVSLWPPGSEPRAVDVGTAGMVGGRYVVRREANRVALTEPDGDVVGTLPAGDAAWLVSPDGRRAVWWTAGGDREAIKTLIPIYGSDIEGRAPRRLLDLWGSHVVSFHPDNQRVLVIGRPARDRARSMLLLLDTVTGAVEVLAAAAFLDGAALSPSGEWVAYMVSLDREHPEDNGVWVTSTLTGERRRLPVDAAYRWRDGHRLAYIPLGSAPWHDVWQFDVATGETRRLLEGRALSLRVANNDWSFSPDGQTLAFVAEQDRSVWVIDLPAN